MCVFNSLIYIAVTSLITIIGIVGYPLLHPNQYAHLLADQSIDHSKERQVYYCIYIFSYNYLLSLESIPDR